MTDTLNLNARRAALREAGAAYPVELGYAEDGTTPLVWHLSAELPVDSLAMLHRGELLEVLQQLLPADELEGFMAQHPSIQEVGEIVTALSNVTVGNLRASRPS